MQNNIKANIVGKSGVRVATATDANDQPLVVVPIENVLVINGYTVSPSATPQQAQRAGDEITAEATRSARLEGVSKIWIVVSDEYDGPGVQTIRVVQETIPQDLTRQRLGFYSPIPPVNYLN